ncbi:MAG: hypothetical protein AAFY71_02630 [Bacteroidota bacterium]
MKQHLLFFFLISILIPPSLKAQHLDSTFFAEGLNLYQQGQYLDAVHKWKAILANGNDTSLFYGSSFNNIAVAYATMDSLETAEIWFNKIFDSKLNDRDEGVDFMQPFANYRHNAAMVCAKMFVRHDMPAKALPYIWLADTLYSYKTFSGTGFEKRAVSIAMWKDELYTRLSQPDQALFVLLHKIMDREIGYRLPEMSSISYQDFYAPFREKLINRIQEKYTTKAFKKKLDKALKTARMFTRKKQDYIEFELYGKHYVIGTSVSKKEFKKRIVETMFYSLL